jgi:hypothetical protein
MKVAVLCEYSGIVRDAFIRAGHDAISCDLLPSESDFGPHLKVDIFNHIDLWETMDLIIAHPPCTHIAVSGNRWHAGTKERLDGAEFFYRIWAMRVPVLCIENPVNVVGSIYKDLPKPQYIHPWQFGHGETKKTGLWKRGLPDLIPTNIVEGREQRIWKMGPSPDRGKERSRFYPGIAEAMADQWGK